ncbi:hypothetical protein TWF696_009174 [Orbilia brochopaga]|uniref:Uncharacterized protein n=1 Tax=Orbilia brochopaga TaxID=3140254 RepID=A0AAV9UIF5_9PEZI
MAPASASDRAVKSTYPSLVNMSDVVGCFGDEGKYEVHVAMIKKKIYRAKCKLAMSTPVLNFLLIGNNMSANLISYFGGLDKNECMAICVLLCVLGFLAACGIIHWTLALARNSEYLRRLAAEWSAKGAKEATKAQEIQEQALVTREAEVKAKLDLANTRDTDLATRESKLAEERESWIEKVQWLVAAQDSIATIRAKLEQDQRQFRIEVEQFYADISQEKIELEKLRETLKKEQKNIEGEKEQLKLEWGQLIDEKGRLMKTKQQKEAEAERMGFTEGPAYFEK